MGSWTDADKAEYSAIESMRRLYNGDHESYFISFHNLPERIFDYMTINVLGDFVSQTWKRFLFRRFPNLEVPDAVAPFLSTLDLNAISPIAEVRKSYAGNAVIRIRYSQLQQKTYLQVWGLERGQFTTYEYLDIDKSSPVAVNFWSLKDLNAVTTTYVRERYELIVNSSTLMPTSVIYTKWEEGYNGFEPGGEVKGTRESPIPLALTTLPYVKISNPSINGTQYGDSDYTTSLIDLQYNINRLMAGRALVCYISETPIMDVPADALDENGNLDLAKLTIRVRQDGDTSGADIKLMSWTGNLENSSAQLEFYNQYVYQLSGIAPAMAGVVDSQGRSGLARRLGMVPTEAEISSRRHIWDNAYNEIIKRAIDVNNVFAPTKLSPLLEPIHVSWDSAIPTEDVETANNVVNEYTSGVRSLESAVKLLPLNANLSGQAMLDEIELVRQNELKKAVQNMPSFADRAKKDQKTAPNQLLPNKPQA